MVDLMGHLAFGLLFALPAWFRWDDRVSLGFVGLAAVAAFLPDVDLLLVALFPGEVHHHGVTHTVLFVTVAALAGAAVVTALLTERFDEWVGGESFDSPRLFAFSFLGLLAGGFSHVFADMLSAPDVSTPVEPLWPLVDGAWGVDLVWYNARWINVGFLAVMLVVHVAVAYHTTPADRHHRLLPV